MKHFTIYTLSALLVLAACEREAIPINERKTPDDGERITLRFGVPATRSEIDGTTGAMTWTSGDQVALCITNGSTARYETVSVNTSASTAEITLDAGYYRNNYAVYPASAVPGSPTSAQLSAPAVVYPATYDYSGKTLATYSPCPMVAVNSGSVLTFYHVGGLLRLNIDNIPDGVNKFVVSFNGMTNTTGTYNVTNAGTGSATMSLSSGSGNTVTITTGSVSTSTTLNIPLPSGSYSAFTGITVDAISASTGLSLASTTKNFSIGNYNRTRGRKLGFAFTVDAEVVLNINGSDISWSEGLSPGTTYTSTITIDQTKTDPGAMVSGDVNGKAIMAIRANSHRYLGKYTASGTMTLCQLDDNDGTKYHDGTAAVLTGSEGDVFMRLPEFHYKVTNAETDNVSITFVYGTKPDASYTTWNSGQLVGVYLAYNSSSKLYSRSGVVPSSSITYANFKSYARARGTGYHLVTWEWFNMMIALYLGYYGNMNSQEICGYGTIVKNHSLGGTNSLGMNDTSSIDNPDFVNFWGLEDWWANNCSAIDNISLAKYSSTSGTLTVTNPISGSTRTLSTKCSFGTGYVSFNKRVITSQLDIFPGVSHTSGANQLGWCDAWTLASAGKPRMGGNTGHPNYGISNIFFNWDGAASVYSCTRIAFTGTIVLQNNVSTFKGLTPIN